MIQINFGRFLSKGPRVKADHQHITTLFHRKRKTELDSIVRRILPKPIADTVRPTGSKSAHLYGLPKTHKDRLAMRPILSATQTCNYALAKWLDAKLKPQTLKEYLALVTEGLLWMTTSHGMSTLK